MWFQQMHPEWQEALAAERPLLDRLEAQLGSLPNLAPRADLVMAAFATSPASVRVLIVGQDPYPTPGVAVGRAFAVAGSKLPGSLRNIFKELTTDIGVGPLDGDPEPDLTCWQDQGVMLLNRHLTTLEEQAGAHFAAGWEDFTDAVVRHLVASCPYLIVVLWGAQAQQLKKTLQSDFAAAGESLFVIEGVHPSPLSANRGFFGSRPFSAINRQLQLHGLEPIDWFI